MPATPTTETPLIDPKTGRLRPLSEAELRAHNLAVLRMLDEIEAMEGETDEDDAVWDEILRRLAAPRSGGTP